MIRFMEWSAWAALLLLVTACGGGRNGIEVEISPANAEMVPLTELQFDADVRGTLDRKVQWSIETLEGFPSADAGQLDGSGLYQAPKKIPPESLNLIRIRATSVVDPTRYAESIVRVVPAPLEPKAGPSTGGTNIHISGSNFSIGDIPTVYFDGVASPEVTVETEVLLIAKTPEHVMGDVDVRLEWSDGREMVWPQAFRYSAGSFQFSGGNLIRPCGLYSGEHVTVDLDGCGGPEIVVACDSEQKLSVTRNTDGTLGDVTRYPFPNDLNYYAYDMEAADLNGDGWQDIVFHGSQNGVVFLNKGTTDPNDCSTWQEFETPSPFTTYTYAGYGFDLTDMTGDNIVDYVVGYLDYQTYEYGITIIPGDGNGSFDYGSRIFHQIPNSEGRYPYYIATGDVDNDGDADLATGLMYLGGSSSYYDMGPALYLNDGQGNLSFGGSVNLQSTAEFGYPYPYGVEIADTDADQRAEVYYAMYDSVGIVELDYDAGNNFVMTQAFQTGLASAWDARPRVQDFNGDGSPDLAYRSEYDYNNELYEVSIAVLFGDATSPGLLPATEARRIALPNYAYDVHLTDLDGDDVPEMTTSDSYAYDNFMVVMQGNEVSQADPYSLAFGPDFLALSAAPTSMRVAHAGADQMPAALVTVGNSSVAVVDLMTGAAEASTGTYGIGAGAYANTSILAGPGETPGSQVSHARATELNNDPYEDILVVEKGSETLPGAVWLSIGGVNNEQVDIPLAERFSVPQKVVPSEVAAQAGRITDAVAYDVDSDGLLDIVYGMSYGPEIAPVGQMGVVWGAEPPTARIADPNDVQTFFFEPTDTVLQTGFAPERIGVADLNGDTLPDLVGIDRQGNRAVIIENLGTKERETMLDTTNPHAFAVGEAPRDLVVTDVDNDGFKDLIVLAQIIINDATWTEVDVLLNHGAFGFGHPQTGQPRFYRVPGNPYQLSYADLDSDGLEDIAVSSVNPAAMVMLRAAGDGEFLDGEVFVAGARPQGVGVADFNQDGKLDLAVSDFDREGMRFLTNLSF